MHSNTISITKSFSIDEKRKKYTKKIKKNRFIKFLIVSFLWTVILIFLFSPFSKVKYYNIQGNIYLSEEEIIDIANIDNNILFFLLDENKIENVLQNELYINNSKIILDFQHANIEIKEIYPVATIGENYLLSNGNIIEQSYYMYKERINSRPIIATPIDYDKRVELSSLLSVVDNSLIDKMKEIKIIEKTGYTLCDIQFIDPLVGYLNIRLDFSLIDQKLDNQEYNYIVEEIAKEDIIYTEDLQAYVRYDLINIHDFVIVEQFEE